MLKNLPLTSALVIISSFTSEIFILKILLTLLFRKTSNSESRYEYSAQLPLPKRSRLREGWDTDSDADAFMQSACPGHRGHL